MDQQSFIYKFLLSPRFRMWRYLALIVFFTIISLNQALVGYESIIHSMGDKIYWIIAGTILVYITTVYWFSKVVVNYLLSGKYIKFIACVFFCALLFLSIPNIIYQLYIKDYNFFSGATLVDNLSAFVIYLLCISGVFIPVFLSNWIISNQYLDRLKVKQKSSQIEQLKEQINPTSFFKILNRSKSLIKSEPAKASMMLMKLGQLLRYQLYDCNRDQVLLTAEISFLQNFLELEKLYSSTFNYTLNVANNMNGIFVPSSILLPYVQNVMNVFDNKNSSHNIDIHIDKEDTAIIVALAISDIDNTFSLQNELLKTRERLNTLYKDHYELTIKKEQSIETVKMILQSNKK